MRPIVTLTTDFGMGAYVAQMKGVLLAECQDVQIVDVTHAIAPQNIMQGALVLADFAPMYPADTYHWIVVDPGVGSNRHLLYAEIGKWKFISPDNGLLSIVAEQWPVRRLIRLTNREYWRSEISPTFHGRDIMASVLGNLLAGLEPSLLGPSTKDFVKLVVPQPRVQPGSCIDGEILIIDEFGNAITNISWRHMTALTQDGLPHRIPQIQLENCKVRPRWCETYSEGKPADFVALIDSQGRLEIAVVNGNAARELGLKVGLKLSLFIEGEDVVP